MFQLTTGTTQDTGTTVSREQLRRDFECLRCIRLPALFGADLLEGVQRSAASSGFVRRDVPDIGTQMVAGSRTAHLLALMLLNREPFLQFVEAVTGRSPIRGFTGTVYRLDAGTEQRMDWHTDELGSGRLLAMSLNLSPEPYEGGRFQNRDRGSRTLLREVANTGPGDATLFDIGPDLEHRVLPVTGSVPRTALAGWLLDRPYTRRPGLSR